MKTLLLLCTANDGDHVLMMMRTRRMATTEGGVVGNCTQVRSRVTKSRDGPHYCYPLCGETCPSWLAHICTQLGYLAKICSAMTWQTRAPHWTIIKYESCMLNCLRVQRFQLKRWSEFLAKATATGEWDSEAAQAIGRIFWFNQYIWMFICSKFLIRIYLDIGKAVQACC